MKWLRAHTKQIMVAVVLFSMFAFVGGTALENILVYNPASAVFAEAFGREYRGADIEPARRDTDVLRQLNTAWNFGMGREFGVEHWFLLAEEAERAGVVVSEQEIDAVMRSVAANAAALNQRGLSTPTLRYAVSRHLMISKHARSAGSCALPTEAQVRQYVRDTEEKVSVVFATLDAAKFTDPDEPISEAELAEQFERHKDVSPDESPDGIGYRYPDRVKVQYARAFLPNVAMKLEVTLDEAKAHWRKYKEAYTTTELIAVAKLPEEPTPPPSRTVEMRFSEARPRVEQEVRDRKALQRSEQAMRKAAAELQRPWFTQQTDPTTGYKPVPPGADDSNVMQAVIESVAKEFGIEIEYQETPLAARTELQVYPGFASAKMPGDSSDLALVDYAFRVPPLHQRDPSEESPFQLQLFQTPDSPLASMSAPPFGEPVVREFMLFRVVEARPSGSPSSLDDVRAAVEQDIRRRRAYERLESRAKEMYAVARRLGVHQAVQAMPDVARTLPAGFAVTPAPFARKRELPQQGRRNFWLDAVEQGRSTLETVSVPGVGGTSDEFNNACFEMAAEGWTPPDMELPTTTQTAAVATQPAMDPPPLVRLVALPKLKRWAVIELKGLEPVRQDRYDSELRRRGYESLLYARFAAVQVNWYKPRNIEARCGYKIVRAEEDIPPIEGVRRPPPALPRF